MSVVFRSWFELVHHKYLGHIKQAWDDQFVQSRWNDLKQRHSFVQSVTATMFYCKGLQNKPISVKKIELSHIIMEMFVVIQ